MTVAPNARNIFEQLGFPADEARDLAVRSILMSAVRRMIRHRRMTPVAAAEQFGTRAERIRDVITGRIGAVTADELLEILVCAGMPVLHGSEHDPAALARARAVGIDVERLEALLQLTPEGRLQLNRTEVRLARSAVARISGDRGGTMVIQGTSVPLAALLDARASGATLDEFLAAHLGVDARKAQLLWRCDAAMLARLIERGLP